MTGHNTNEGTVGEFIATHTAEEIRKELGTIDTSGLRTTAEALNDGVRLFGELLTLCVEVEQAETSTVWDDIANPSGTEENPA